MPGKKLCFVVGPIGAEGSDVRAHADWVLEGIIRPVFLNFPDFEVKRSDEDARPGLIDVHIINDLIDADLVVADLSLLNPNAFYEIGIRHMVQKPIVHMQLANEKTPFDVSLYRAIKFALRHPSDLEQAKENLKQAVEATNAEGYQTTNPVTNARTQLQLRKDATPETRVLLDRIESLSSRLAEMESIVDLVRPKPDPMVLAHILSQPQINAISSQGTIYTATSGGNAAYLTPAQGTGSGGTFYYVTPSGALSTNSIGFNVSSGTVGTNMSSPRAGAGATDSTDEKKSPVK